ncbi:MAG: IclR family transcriptional regulator [Thalassobaculales bacterium]
MEQLNPSLPALGDGAGRGAARRRGRPAGANSRDGGQVQSLVRALNLLKAVAESPHGAGLSDLAHRVGLAPSTAHRLLKSLLKERFVAHDPQRGAWSIGVEAFTVGSAFLEARDLVAKARPLMQDLMEESGESINLGVLQGNEVVFLAQVECREMMRALARPGGRAPLHCSGMGKAILAMLPERQRDALTQRDTYPRFTNKTLNTRAALLEDMKAIRARGYALDDEEFAPGLRCVAAAVLDENGEPLGAVSLSGPSARLPDTRLAALGRLVADTARRITQEMGGRLR